MAPGPDLISTACAFGIDCDLTSRATATPTTANIGTARLSIDNTSSVLGDREKYSQGCDRHYDGCIGRFRQDGNRNFPRATPPRGSGQGEKNLPTPSTQGT